MSETTAVAASNPFAAGRAAAVPSSPVSQANAIAASDQQRAIAEVQAAMAIARANPRDQLVAMDRILMACSRPSLAESALYSYSRGGTDITGPSIRLAEAIAQSWGNISYGVRELDQRGGESTVQAYAWDVETNTRREMTFQVSHVRHTKKGSYRLEDPRDIYEMVANQGARRLRACILGVVPGDVVDEAARACEMTLKSRVEITPTLIASIVEKFSVYGVTKDMIEARIQRRIDALTPGLVVNLGKILNSLKDGMSSASDWFADAAPPASPDDPPPAAKKMDALKEKARAAAAAAKSVAPAGTPPAATYAVVASAMAAAKTPQALDDASLEIGSVESPEQREELAALYRQLSEKLHA